jgi:CRISPR/Cas system CMR subunit Cmr4 (Cas7 group RAMP superfamily)
MKLTVARFTIELLSPMHIGSGLSSAATDAPVVRDAFGDYRIPGSSLAGALRAGSGDDPAAWGAAGREQNSASMIEVSDGFLVDFDGKVALGKRLANEKVLFRALAEIQDHVRIGHDSGTAEEGGKFDAELIPQGTRFRCELSLAEREGASQDSRTRAINAFRQALSLLSSGDLALGGDVSSGLGRVMIVKDSLTVGVFDLTTSKGLEAARNRSASIGDAAGSDDAAAFVSGGAGVGTDRGAEDDLVRGSVTIRFETDGPLLVGGSQRPSTKGGADKNHGADLVFGESLVADYAAKALVARPWVPGSSLRGALRHRTWHALEALGRTDAEAIIDDLFGSVDGDTGKASKIRIHGCFLEDEPRTAVQHVAIDRLTGGSLRGALFSEAPIWKDGLGLQVRLTLHGVSPAQAAVIAHALIDMGTGHLPIGGGTRRGNGRLRFADDPRGFQGKAVRFHLTHGKADLKDTSAPHEIDAFIEVLERANNQLAGATA